MTKKKKSKKTTNINRGYTETGNDNTVQNLIKIILIIAAAFVLFYMITYFVTKHNKKYSWENNNESSIIQYDKIMFGTLFSQGADEYYALEVADSNDNKDIYDTYIAMYKDKDEALSFYTIDLDSAFNKKYLSENSNLETNDLNELKVKETTLFKIKNSKIIEHIEGNEQIIEKFKSLVK